MNDQTEQTLNQPGKKSLNDQIKETLNQPGKKGMNDQIGQTLNQPGKTHKGKRQYPCRYQRDRHTLHPIRDINKLHLLPEPGQDHQRKTKTNGRGGTVNGPGYQVVIFLYDKNGNAKHRTVRGYQWQEDAQSLVKWLTDLFEDDLNHLNQRCYHQNKSDCLHKGNPQRYKYVCVDQVGDHGGQHHYKSHGTRHPNCRTDLIRNTQKRAYPKKLGKNNVVDQYRRNYQ